MTNKEHFIYCIEVFGFYKVGCTSSLYRRLRSFETASPEAIRVVFTRKVHNREFLLLAEKKAHK